MTSTSSVPASAPSLYVVGSGSKIFQALDWGLPYVPVSARAGTLDDMPAFVPGSTIVVFADPPNIDDALAMMISVIGSSPANGDVRIVFISSISALFDQSDVFPEGGVYSRKKRAVERFIEASLPSGASCIVRFGNVFECGGWADIAANCPVALLPRGFDRCAVSDLASIRSRLIGIVRDREAGAVNLWEDRPVAAFFTDTRSIPGTGTLYRNRLGRIALKIAAKILRKAGIYLPSPDDINSFNPRLLRRLAA